MKVGVRLQYNAMHEFSQPHCDAVIQVNATNAL